MVLSVLFKKMIFLLLTLWFLPGVDSDVAQDFSEPLHAESEQYVVSFLRSERFGPRDSKHRFVLLVRDKRTQRESFLQVQNLTDKVNRLAIVDDDLVVFGMIDSYGMDVVTLFDLQRGEEKDSFLAYALSQSDTKRYLIYEEWHPRITDEGAASDVILVYDLQASLQENRLGPVEQGTRVSHVGHPIFPEENVQKQAYRFWIEAEQERHLITPWARYLWIDHDRKVVFVDEHKGEKWLVMVDLSAGLDKVQVSKKVIKVAKVLVGEPGSPGYETLLKEGKKRLIVKELREKEGKIVLSIEPDMRFKMTEIEMTLP